MQSDLPQFDPRFWRNGAMNCKVLHHLSKLETTITQEQCPEYHLRMWLGQPKHVFNALVELEVREPYLHTLNALEREALRLAVAGYRESLGKPELHREFLDQLTIFE